MAIREVIIHLPGHNQRSVMALGTTTFGVPGIRSNFYITRRARAQSPSVDRGLALHLPTWSRCESAAEILSISTGLILRRSIHIKHDFHEAKSDSYQGEGSTNHRKVPAASKEPTPFEVDMGPRGPLISSWIPDACQSRQKL